jgi:hypothetical protein
MTMSNATNDNKNEQYKLIVNKKEKEWGEQFITAAQILTLAESPSDWVVNMLIHEGRS